ncbi:MAG: hypothetical protein ACRESJ_12585 [Pseudomonas sp.]|uniref:hypothetical protein n=1 Tax=Pseudomonas sp. TaxID=306 RepID=UPI003D6F69FB
MNKDQERSFIARLYCHGKKLSFFETSTPATLLTTEEVIGRRVAYHPYRNEWIPTGQAEIKSSILVHFHCYDDYYNLQILSKDNKYISKDEHGFLGAFPAAGGNTTSFNLLDSHYGIVTLDDFGSSNMNIYLKARHSRIIRQSIWEGERNKYHCFTGETGDISIFNLEILERSVVTPRDLASYGEH